MTKEKSIDFKHLPKDIVTMIVSNLNYNLPQDITEKIISHLDLPDQIRFYLIDKEMTTTGITNLKNGLLIENKKPWHLNLHLPSIHLTFKSISVHLFYLTLFIFLFIPFYIYDQDDEDIESI